MDIGNMESVLSLMMTDNLALWNAVEETDMAYTKPLNFGAKLTAIDPTYQSRLATEVFGPYGYGWGIRDADYSIHEMTYGSERVPVVVLKATFFWLDDAGNEHLFPVIVDGMAKANDDVMKKLMTSAKSKALSFLGFNADVYLGKFDDSAYVKDLEIKQGKSKGFKASALAAIKMAADSEKVRVMASRVNGMVATEVISAGDGRELMDAIEKRSNELGDES